MDPSRVVEALSFTLVAEKQEHGAKLLTEMHKIIGFVPTLLNIVLEPNINVSIRQAAALYFKNNISEWWKDQEPSANGELKFSIHEQDKQTIRNSIVTAVVSSPAPLQSQLKVALSLIITRDYPGRFLEFPDQVKHYMLSSDQHQWHGALICFYAYVKVYEYKKSSECAVILPTMRSFFPIFYSAVKNLIGDVSEDSQTLQKLILKIFFAFINFHFPLDAIEKESLGHWIELFCAMLSDLNATCSESNSSIWKLKKWALRILCRMFTRYGSPGVVLKKYSAFAEWYLKSFSAPILSVLLNICEAYRQKSFISKPVLSQTLEYFSSSLSHSFSWKILRPHFPLLVREVIFPLLSYSDEDAELWEDDPVEYIRIEAAEWGNSSSPSAEAFSLLREACIKRRGVLNHIIPFCTHILASSSSPIEKDAVLHIYGAIAELLLKKDTYKSQLEPFLVNHVLPTLQAPEGFRRARACWLLGKLSDATFNDQQVFSQVVNEVRRAACFDSELPVRAFASLCLSDFIQSQESVHELLLPHLRELLLRLLELLRSTEFDDLNQVIERVLVSYEKDIIPIASEIMQNLSDTFIQLVHASQNGFTDGVNEHGDSEDIFEYRSVVATSVLDNMESVLQITEDHEQLTSELEPIVANLIKLIFDRTQSLFYDEALTLLFSLTTNKISPLMWQLFDQLYPVFQKDAYDSFSEMMPCLHNYMTVGRSTFLSDPKYIEQVTSMCTEVFALNDFETVQLNAAKLLEVLLIDYRGQIDRYVPRYIELALGRLTQPVVSSELRTMCLQVVIAGMLYSPMDMLRMMMEHCWPGTNVTILTEFLKRWLQDADCFLGLHDRRLCVLGLCLLLSLPADQRPEAVVASHKEYIPTLLLLFTGLKRAYAVKAQNQNDDDSSDELEDDDDLEDKELGSDEDDVNEDNARYLEMLDAEDDVSNNDDDDDDDDDDAETTLEAFDTQLDKPECDMDEYVTFYRVMTELERTDANWYTQLVGHLTDEQQIELKGVVDTAVKCIQQKESKMIEQAGGYTFRTTIPSSFDFGSPPNGQP